MEEQFIILFFGIALSIAAVVGLQQLVDNPRENG